jgi:hypothetical protein
MTLTWQPVADWVTLKGLEVEVFVGGRMLDRGHVDDVMADGSLLWLMQQGASERRIIENQPETHLRLASTQR